MAPILSRLTVLTAVAGTFLAVGTTRTDAQQPKFSEVKVEALATGDEIAAQPDLWVMEVYFKPMRQIVIDLTDKSGQKKPEYVWYITYRAINRPLALKARGNRPTNDLDLPIIPPRFIPEFTLITTDTEEPKIYHDEVIPEAIAAINKRERASFKSTVNVVTDVSAAVEPGSPDEKFIYGVATWRGIDSDADRYTVFLTGFSNGLKKVTADDGTVGMQNKTIMTKYWRPGDRFNQREPEIRIDGAPQWIYR
jgi:hypothetical protein